MAYSLVMLFGPATDAHAGNAATTVAQAFPFVHPGMALAALLTGLIPLVIHLINRRRFRRIPWAAMSFLMAANRRSASRLRFEQLVLMLVRVSLIVLLGLAIARPFLPASGVLPFSAIGSSRVHHVLLIDNSLSMNAFRDDGRTRFQAAQEAAARLLASFSPSDAVSIVTLASPVQRVIGHAAFDGRVIRERVASIRPTQRAGDTAGGVAAAAEILNASQVAPGNRSVYVISDFPRREWADAPNDGERSGQGVVAAFRRLAEQLEAEGGDLTFVDVDDTAASGGRPGPVKRTSNLAITSLSCESAMIGVDLPVRVVAEVTNFGDAPVRGVSLQFRRDGVIVRRQELATIRAGGVVLAGLTTVFAEPGTHAIEARITPPSRNVDALRIDDARFVSIDVRPFTRVLVVDGRPAARLLDSQSGLLATALSPSVIADASLDRGIRKAPRRASLRNLVATTVVAHPELAAEVLSTYDVVALCNVPRLSAERWRELRRFTERGGGLLVFLGDLVSRENYNRYGCADGNGVLPGLIERAVDFDRASVASPGSSSGGSPMRHNGFALDDPPHPLVAEFADFPLSGLFAARVDRYLPLTLEPGAADVVLRYTNNVPAWVAATVGDGRVLVSTTSANMDWNNLPAKGDFVSLMLNAVAFLAPQRGQQRNVLVGQSLRESLTPVQSAMPHSITQADGVNAQTTLVPDDGSLALSFGPVEQAGFLSLAIGPQRRIFAANVDPAECDLAVATREQVNEALGQPVRRVLSAKAGLNESGGSRSTELGPVVLYVVVALLLVELWLAMRFGLPRGVPAATGTQVKLG